MFIHCTLSLMYATTTFNVNLLYLSAPTVCVVQTCRLEILFSCFCEVSKKKKKNVFLGVHLSS